MSVLVGRGLEHVGVPYESAEALVALTGPRVADALARGDDVYLSVDRRTARLFREQLGPVADQIEFPSPSDWLQDVARDLRAVVRDDRRTLVLGQYTALGGDGAAFAEIEDGINLVLTDLPLTLMCTCAGGADARLLAALHRGHPDLLVDHAIVPNVDYRPPAPSRPVSADVWGPPTLRLDLLAPADLHRLREHVGRAAGAVGLRGDAVRDAVLSVHEAAMLATGGLDTATLESHLGPYAADTSDGEASTDAERPVPCVLEVRAEAGVLHCEVLSRRPEVTTVPVQAGGDPLSVVRVFCDQALLHDEQDIRSVRVLRAPARA